MLGIGLPELRRLLAGVKPVRGAKEPRFRWREIASRLTRDQIAESLVAAQKRRMRGVSRRWVGGYPHLVAEWHPTRNGTQMPWEVSYGSARQFWWRCPAGPDHEWRARASRRVLGDGCPFCANQRASVTNCLATQAPAVARQWHPTRNGRLTPRDVVVGSVRRVWWKCPGGPDHEWRARIFTRTVAGAGCPCCAGRQLSVTNSLATKAPELAAEWHPSRNGALRPSELVAYSTRLVWWKCSAADDHCWRETPNVRLSHRYGCPYCSGKRVTASNSLARRAPDVAREWHPTKNAPLTPRDVTAGSQRLVWWRCRKNPEHEWQAAILNRARRHVRKGSGCPICFRADRGARKESRDVRP